MISKSFLPVIRISKSCDKSLSFIPQGLPQGLSQVSFQPHKQSILSKWSFIELHVLLAQIIMDGWSVGDYFVVVCLLDNTILDSTKFKAFTLFQTSPCFYLSAVQVFENSVGKGEIGHNEQFLLFPQCFLSVWRTFCHFYHIWNCCLQTLWIWKCLKVVGWERINFQMINDATKTILVFDTSYQHFFLLPQCFKNYSIFGLFNPLPNNSKF